MTTARASTRTRPSSGFGLVGMRERLALVRGTLEIETAPGGGTALHAVDSGSRSRSRVTLMQFPASAGRWWLDEGGVNARPQRELGDRPARPAGGRRRGRRRFSPGGAAPALGRDRGRKGHGHGDHGGRGSIPRENISIQLYTLRVAAARRAAQGPGADRLQDGRARRLRRRSPRRSSRPRCASTGSRRPRGTRASRSRGTRRRGASRSPTRSRSGSATSSTRRARSCSSRPTATRRASRG